jgi:RNHCP domain
MSRTVRGPRSHRPNLDGTFTCVHCGFDVPLRAPGTAHRNHCPNCLWSRHLDAAQPGDRSARCAGTMEPIAICVRGAGEWVLIHRCKACGELALNRTAGDDSALLLVQLAVRPLAQAPFPLDVLARL